MWNDMVPVFFLGAGMDERFVEVDMQMKIWQKVSVVCQLQEDCRRKENEVALSSDIGISGVTPRLGKSNADLK